MFWNDSYAHQLYTMLLPILYIGRHAASGLRKGNQRFEPPAICLERMCLLDRQPRLAACQVITEGNTNQDHKPANTPCYNLCQSAALVQVHKRDQDNAVLLEAISSAIPAWLHNTAPKKHYEYE